MKQWRVKLFMRSLLHRNADSNVEQFELAQRERRKNHAARRRHREIWTLTSAQIESRDTVDTKSRDIRHNKFRCKGSVLTGTEREAFVKLFTIPLERTWSN